LVFVVFFFFFNLCCIHRNHITFFLSATSYSSLPPAFLLLFTIIYTGTLPSQHTSSSFIPLVYEERPGCTLSELERPKAWGAPSTMELLSSARSFSGSQPTPLGWPTQWEKKHN